MDLLTAFLVCNLYGEDPALVRAIAANSHENPSFVTDAAADASEFDVSPEPKTEAEALARVTDITAHGGRPLLGLLELAPAWLPLFGRALRDAFDPCVNVAIGSAMLSAFDNECAHESRSLRPGARPASTPGGRALSPRRLCVLGKYGEAIGEADFEEVIALELNSPSPGPFELPPREAPIFPALPPPTWGPDCLLVPWLVPRSAPALTPNVTDSSRSPPPPRTLTQGERP